MPMPPLPILWRMRYRETLCPTMDRRSGIGPPCRGVGFYWVRLIREGGWNGVSYDTRPCEQNHEDRLRSRSSDSEAMQECLLALHGFDQLIELAGVGDFDKRPCRVLAAHHVNRRRVLDANLLAQLFFGIHLGSEFSLRINHERKLFFVIRRELAGETLQRVGSDFGLVLEDVVAEFFAQLLRARIEIMRDHRSLIRPVVHGQREVVANERYLVRFGCLLLERRVLAAHGTLQVLEYDQSHARAFRRAQH